MSMTVETVMLDAGFDQSCKQCSDKINAFNLCFQTYRKQKAMEKKKQKVIYLQIPIWLS